LIDELTVSIKQIAAPDGQIGNLQIAVASQQCFGYYSFAGFLLLLLWNPDFKPMAPLKPHRLFFGTLAALRQERPTEH
jgi:hypothetical protein